MDSDIARKAALIKQELVALGAELSRHDSTDAVARTEDLESMRRILQRIAELKALAEEHDLPFPDMPNMRPVNIAIECSGCALPLPTGLRVPLNEIDGIATKGVTVRCVDCGASTQLTRNTARIGDPTLPGIELPPGSDEPA
jgi:hypothetical protein